MSNLNFLYDANKSRLIEAVNNIITFVSQTFADMTEYAPVELIGLNISDLIKTLRIGPNININNIDTMADYFLFTKSLEARFVKIKTIKEIDRIFYFFNEDEKSRLEDKFSYCYQLCKANIVGMSIYSVPDLTLLKANKMYLEFFEPPYNCDENTFGRTIYDFVTGFAGSDAEKMWKAALETGEPSFIKELQYTGFTRGITYWDIIITPIKEGGELKYIITNTQEVTERVFHKLQLEEKNKIIEQQNKQIEAILDNMNDGFSIIDKDGNFIKHNKTVMKLSQGKSLKKSGDTYDLLGYYDLNRKKLDLNDIPSSKVLRGEKLSKFEYLIKYNGTEMYLSTSGTPIYDEEGNFTFGILSTRNITDNMKHLKLIEQQKIELETIMDNISDLIFVYDSNGNYIYVNKAADKYFSQGSLKKYGDGFVKSEYLDLNKNLIPQEHSPFNTVMRSKKPDKTVLIMRKGAEEFYLQIKTIPLLDNSGCIDMVISLATDITEHINHSKLVQQQKEELEVILDNISDALVVYDKDGKIFKINAEAKNLFSHINETSVLNEAFSSVKFLDGDGNELTYEKLPAIRALKGEKIKNIRMTVKRFDSQRSYDVNSSPIFDGDENIIMSISSCRDMTEQVKREETIRNQKKQLDAIINSMSDGLELVDSNFKITLLNQAAKDFFFNPDDKIYAGDSLKHNKYFYGIDGEEILKEDLPAFKVITKGSFENYILTIVRPDKKMYISVNGSPIYDDSGNVKEAVLCLRDITQQVMLDMAIEHHQRTILQTEREKNEALEKSIEMKDEFLSLISHEFRTPLNVISTAVQALNFLYADKLPDKVKEYIGTINQNTLRQLRLVNNLLDITRASAGRIRIYKRNFDIVFLTKSITESVYQYALQKGVNIYFETSLRHKIIGMDDEKYERILLNLLSNAIKFTPKEKDIIVKLYSLKGSIVVEVKDFGIGIPEDKLNVIFERFGQVDSTLSRQAEGAGIGLSLVKKLVEALGGNIFVKSRVGKGSTFTLLLPSKKTAPGSDDLQTSDLMDNHLVQIANVEFSDIYL